MAPHITEVQRPTRMKAKMPTGTCAQITFKLAQSMPGTLTCQVCGASIPNSTSAIAVMETVVTIAFDDTFAPMAPPMKRPMSIISQ